MCGDEGSEDERDEANGDVISIVELRLSEGIEVGNDGKNPAPPISDIRFATLPKSAHQTPTYKRKILLRSQKHL